MSPGGAPTLDEAVRALPEILEYLKKIEAKQDQIISLLATRQLGLVRPIYDHSQLMELGIGRDHAYDILRAHGVVRRGRRKITQEKLMEYYSKEERNG